MVVAAGSGCQDPKSQPDRGSRQETSMADQPPGSNAYPGAPEVVPVGAHALDPDLADSASVVLPPSAAPARHATPSRLGKVRSPVGCWLLVLVTFGIYGLFWYHHTNR